MRTAPGRPLAHCRGTRDRVERLTDHQIGEHPTEPRDSRDVVEEPS